MPIAAHTPERDLERMAVECLADMSGEDMHTSKEIDDGRAN